MSPVSVGSSLDELVKDLSSQEQVQQHEIRSAENVVQELDTILEVLNSGMSDLRDHLSTAAAPQEQQQQHTHVNVDDEDYLQSLLDDIPSYSSSPAAPSAVENRYIAMKNLGAPPSSPPPFDDDEDEDSSSQSQQQQQQQSPLPMSQRIARKSISNLASSSSSSSGSTPPASAAPVSHVHGLLCTVFRDHATGRRNTKNARHKILDIAHNIAKENIQ